MGKRHTAQAYSKNPYMLARLKVNLYYIKVSGCTSYAKKTCSRPPALGSEASVRGESPHCSPKFDCLKTGFS